MRCSSGKPNGFQISRKYLIKLVLRRKVADWGGGLPALSHCKRVFEVVGAHCLFACFRTESLDGAREKKEDVLRRDKGGQGKLVLKSREL